MSLRDIIDAVRANSRGPSRIKPKAALNFDEHNDSVLMVYLFRGVGDAALFAPLLSEFRKRYPSTGLGIVVSELAAKTLRLFNLEVDIYEVPNAWFSAINARTKQKQEQKTPLESCLKREIQASGFTVGIELTGSGSIPASDWFDGLGLRYTIGWSPTVQGMTQAKTNPDFHFDHSVPDIRYHADRHWSFALCQALSILGIDTPDQSLDVPTYSPAQNWAEKQWKNGVRILIFPGSRDPNKRWNPDRFSEIVNKINETHEVSALVSGAPQEVALVEQVRRGMTAPSTRYAGRDLRRLLALVQTAALVITNDTGPMHLSYLHGTPTVAVYKHMSPIVWGPIKESREFITIETRNRSDHEIMKDIMRFVRQRLRRSKFAVSRR